MAAATSTTNVTSVTNMTMNTSVHRLLQEHNLRMVKVSWDDIDRDFNSCVGNNITDMTLVVNNTRMPIIRPPNYTDITEDLPSDQLSGLRVGNENGSPLTCVTLEHYLKNISKYTNQRHTQNLWASRDATLLTRSQCCVLPCERKKSTQFCVELHNYRSTKQPTGILAIVVSNLGTSAQFIKSGCSEKIYLNFNGRAHKTSIERLQDRQERITGKSCAKLQAHTEMKQNESLDNMLMIIQVPLKYNYRHMPRSLSLSNNYACRAAAYSSASSSASLAGAVNTPSVDLETINRLSKKRSAGVDFGQLSLGSDVGPFNGLGLKKLERDEDKPISVTFQYYRVSDDSTLSQNEVQDIASQLGQARSVASASGSLVVDNQLRPTLSTTSFNNMQTVQNMQNTNPTAQFLKKN